MLGSWYESFNFGARQRVGLGLNPERQVAKLGLNVAKMTSLTHLPRTLHSTPDTLHPKPKTERVRERER